MSTELLDQVESNLSTIASELGTTEEDLEEAFSGATDTEELITVLRDEGLSRERVRRVLQEEAFEVNTEDRAVRAEKDALFRMNENIEIIEKFVELVLEEEERSREPD